MDKETEKRAKTLCDLKYNMCCHLFLLILAVQTDLRRDLKVVLVCIFLMAEDVLFFKKVCVFQRHLFHFLRTLCLVICPIFKLFFLDGQFF